jgi:hypothetical protein
MTSTTPSTAPLLLLHRHSQRPSPAAAAAAAGVLRFAVHHLVLLLLPLLRLLHEAAP